MSLKVTNIEMDWTDTGGRVLSSIPIPCPACGVVVTVNVVHLCGDRILRAEAADFIPAEESRTVSARWPSPEETQR
jgi:hypothetical protein